MDSDFAHRRALAKTVSWRGLSLVFTTVGVWVVTGQLSFAASVGVLEIAVKSGGFYLHERFWERVNLRGLTMPLSFPWFVFRRRSSHVNADSRRGRQEVG
jgi:uncharacterized membrane protein